MKIPSVRTSSSSFLDPFQAELNQQPLRLVGSNRASNTVVLAPVPGPCEVQDKMAWCRPSACWLMDTWKMGYGFSDYIVLPLTFGHPKPNKAAVAFTLRLIHAAVASKQVTRFIAIGPEALKVVLGSVPPVESLLAASLKAEVLRYKPVFSFPPMTAYDTFEAISARCGKNDREFWIAKNQMEKLMDQVDNQVNKLKEFLEL